MEVWWLFAGVVAQEMTPRRSFDSYEIRWFIGMWWLFGDVVAHRRSGGSLEMWWLIGEVVALWRMWWLIGEVVALGSVVALWRCGSSCEM